MGTTSFPPGATVMPFGPAADRYAINVGDQGHVVECMMLVQIHEHIEEECARQDQIWGKRDQDLLTVLYPHANPTPTTIERVLPHNFFIGARPSLVASSIDMWPSITSYCRNQRPSSEQADQWDVVDMDVFVEVMCKAGPVPQEHLQLRPGVDAEGEVNKQAHRLSAAVQMCVKRDPTLGGYVQPIMRPPVRIASEPFAMPGDTQDRNGDYYVYKGMQHRYIVQGNTF